MVTVVLQALQTFTRAYYTLKTKSNMRSHCQVFHPPTLTESIVY